MGPRKEPLPASSTPRHSQVDFSSQPDKCCREWGGISLCDQVLQKLLLKCMLMPDLSDQVLFLCFCTLPIQDLNNEKQSSAASV